MKITFGQITLEGSDIGEINALIALIPTLAAIAQPAMASLTSGAMRTATANATAETYSAEQIESAKEAIAKGYGYEASYKAITGARRLRRSEAEAASGQGSEHIALARLEAIASGIEGAQSAGACGAATDDIDLTE